MNSAGYQQLQHSPGAYVVTGPVRMQSKPQEIEVRYFKIIDLSAFVIYSPIV